MWILAQSDLLKGLNEAVTAANEARDTALIFVLAIVALIVYGLLTRRLGKSNEQTLEAEREYRKLEAETRKDLADAIRSLRDGLNSSQAQVTEQLKLVSGTLEDVDASMEHVASGTNELRTEIQDIIRYVREHPTQYGEIKSLLNRILQKLETGEVPVVESEKS